jgi:hypothetical protein
MNSMDKVREAVIKVDKTTRELASVQAKVEQLVRELEVQQHELRRQMHNVIPGRALTYGGHRYLVVEELEKEDDGTVHDDSKSVRRLVIEKCDDVVM